MKYEEISSEDRYEYTRECELCDLPVTIMTQDNRMSEYITWVYVRCTCGEYVKFELPVN